MFRQHVQRIVSRDSKTRADPHCFGIRNRGAEVSGSRALDAAMAAPTLREPRVAEGVGFEPTRELSPPTRLAGGRTRPLCDPSAWWDVVHQYISGQAASSAAGERRASWELQLVR